MSGLTAFFRLIRFTNLIIIALIIFLTRFCLVSPLSDLMGIPACLTDLHWYLITLATVAIAASGNVINDIMDQDIDAINKPGRLIVGKMISENTSWNIFYGLTIIGLVSGIWVAELVSSDYHGMVFIFCSGSLWFYAQHFKGQFLIGNLTIALLGALVLLVPFFMEYRCTMDNETIAKAVSNHGGRITFPWQGFIFMFAGFSFVTTLIREIIKDMQDMDGDRNEGANTIPIALGFSGAKWISILLTITLMVGVGMMQSIRFSSGDQITFYYLIAGVQIPSLVLIVLLFTGQIPSDMKAPSKLVKLIMLGGILSMLTLRYSFLNA
ncbi:MAG: 4-hydroxybenzoate polyprenyltransferase [Bacteroidia bacterium]|jgi:4-hydroxybenzoate polyprenyltransferase